jgi:Fic family protein
MPVPERITASDAKPLGRYEHLVWQENPNGPSRKHWRGGAYDAFIPVPISELAFDLDGEAVAAVVAAIKGLAELNASPTRVAPLESLARSLVRTEASASSRIEGLVLSQPRLARALHSQGGRASGDRRTADVLGNIEALEQAVALGASAKPITASDIQDIHRTLLRFTDDKDIAGVIRDKQNWLGGSDYHPLDASFVPPPPEHVAPLLDDLCAFIERTDVAAIAQAAIAHAQFETIHPFADGNGRVGRALIYSILKRRGEAERYIPPVSLVLGAEPRTYIQGLTDYRDGRVSEWCAVFAHATQRAAEVAHQLSGDIEALQSRWLTQLGNPRRDAAVRQLIAVLPSHPVIDIAAGVQITNKTPQAVGAAINRLETADILRQLNPKKWGRVWECDELLQLVTDLEKHAVAP